MADRPMTELRNGLAITLLACIAVRLVAWLVSPLIPVILTMALACTIGCWWWERYR